MIKVANSKNYPYTMIYDTGGSIDNVVFVNKADMSSLVVKLTEILMDEGFHDSKVKLIKSLREVIHASNNKKDL